jgi:hypothetical protein
MCVEPDSKADGLDEDDNAGSARYYRARLVPRTEMKNRSRYEQAGFGFR